MCCCANCYRRENCVGADWFGESCRENKDECELRKSHIKISKIVGVTDGTDKAE